MGVATGCPQSFEASEVAVDQPWVSLLADRKTLPIKMKLDVNPDGLAPGEYKATVRVTVPEALNSTLEIPVTLTVVEPPKPEVPTAPIDPAPSPETADPAPTEN